MKQYILGKGRNRKVDIVQQVKAKLKGVNVTKGVRDKPAFVQVKDLELDTKEGEILSAVRVAAEDKEVELQVTGI